jgi:hypothetical protein
MVNRKIAEPGYAAKAMKIFKDSYFAARGFASDEALEERIRTYYFWTMMRTATHFLLKDKPEPERAYPLIDKVCRGLGI